MALQSRPGPDVALIFAQQLLLHGGFQTAELVVQQHPAVLQVVFRTLEHPGIPEPVGLLPPELEPFGLGLVEPGTGGRRSAPAALPGRELPARRRWRGVAARRSATKSEMVTSRLMAHGGDHGESGRDRSSAPPRSSLKAQRSSMEPPPRPVIIRSAIWWRLT